MSKMSIECNHIMAQPWPLGPTVAFNPNSAIPTPCSLCGKILSFDEMEKAEKNVEMMRITIRA